jgi:hypothetical protein
MIVDARLLITCVFKNLKVNVRDIGPMISCDGVLVHAELPKSICTTADAAVLSKFPVSLSEEILSGRHRLVRGHRMLADDTSFTISRLRNGRRLTPRQPQWVRPRVGVVDVGDGVGGRVEAQGVLGEVAGRRGS